MKASLAGPIVVNVFDLIFLIALGLARWLPIGGDQTFVALKTV
jgi:hypothetical protein